MFPRFWTHRTSPWVSLLVSALALSAVWLGVDLTPQVESDFFFAEDDPQLQASRTINETYGSSPQVILRVEDLAGDEDAYEDRVEALTDSLMLVEGILAGYSISTDDPARSPMFRRILLTPDSAATNIVLSTDDTDPEVLLPRIEAVVAEHEGSELAIVMSGVPVIVELVRRNLFRDLIVFSLAAVVVFGLLIGLVYRDVAIVVGTLATCFLSVSITLVLTQTFGVSIGLLTANLVTIVFVLTLSHVVFMTANWARAAAEVEDRADALQRAIRDTLEGSFWSMTTTLLGFASLLVASAKPLRELGVAGAIGTMTAMAVAYAVYPTFLGRWARVRQPTSRSIDAGTGSYGMTAVAVTAASVVFLGFGVLRVDTDPGLLTYFAEGGALRDGLEQIDRDGGSSTLDIVVRDAEGGRLDSDLVFVKMQDLQSALEADSAVGMVLSPSVLLEHAKTLPLASFLSLEVLLDMASDPRLGGVGLQYVTAERDEGHYFLRMHESIDEPSRQAVMDRLRERTVESGLEPVLVGGLYDLQAQLGTLIKSSLRIGIGGLLALFLGVAYMVSRSPGTTARMWLCLAGVPLVVLGVFGHLGIAVDIITSPAANIALAMGVDSMIHLVVRVRTLSAAGVAAPWAPALSQIRAPVLGASGIICAGFGIFILSSFPPTQRFGLAVMLGTVTAAAMTLLVLPRIAGDAAPAPVDPDPA
jgi:predicted RND superfamily exporter protein